MRQIQQLKVVSTVLLAVGVAQVGFAAGFLDGNKPLFAVHRINAFLVLAVTVAAVVVGLGARRVGAPRWVTVLPLVLIGSIGLQIILGFAKVKGIHIFLGVLVLCTITAYCSYCYRLRPEALTGSSTPVEPDPAAVG